jgi:dTDP-N-acetylfucosamine:lipid II N-acetylfucosaminyltransferase
MSRIIHICVPEKFIPPFIRFIRENFPPSEHDFFVGGRRSNDRYGLDMRTVTDCFGIFSKLRHLPKLYKAEKIILHGLYESQFLYLLALQPWLLRKCYWFPWGDDLYQYKNKRTRLKSITKERIRAFVIKNLGFIISYIPGDIALARKWYDTKAVWFDCIGYESNTFTQITNPYKNSGTLVIQVGNSAYPRNNHCDAIDKIAQFALEDIHVIAPLSYGPKNEAEIIYKYGKMRLGNKFSALMNFIPLDKYLAQLRAVDIAVFEQDRQQAMGNMITLIGMGKTLFIRRNTTSWDLFEKIGVKVMDAERFSLSTISDDEKKENIKIVTEYFSKSRLLKQYEKIFNS